MDYRHASDSDRPNNYSHQPRDPGFIEAVDPQVRKATSARLLTPNQPPASRQPRYGASTFEKEIRELNEKLALAMEEVQLLREQLDKSRKQ
ncbi:uncharacterized protein FPRO_10331 [Fusarium proliferatum ET1]|uniref:Uncharacterized protein n=1 Tax=Fusarium proliferatum (strain ET1) TaxID=1227346 RepID=A0A1L7VJJ1_FUSPR|nr:uncharacterized protein FPRO_10331 [Fusarium proliferatum ET1]CZR40743.1 uncharacterized protein FPRO_10331 [Fusarium proliferatum ET1]